MNHLRSLVLIALFLLSNYLVQSQSVDPNVDMMRAAAKHSEIGEIGLFMIAGREYADMNDKEINKSFDDILKNSGIGIKVFIQRTDERSWSSYSSFMDGFAVGGVVVASEDLGKTLKECVKRFRQNRGLPKK